MRRMAIFPVSAAPSSQDDNGGPARWDGPRCSRPACALSTLVLDLASCRARVERAGAGAGRFLSKPFGWKQEMVEQDGGARRRVFSN